MWYVEGGVGEGEGNWLATVYRDDAAAPWRMTYRFRYYRDTQAWESADTRSWYQAVGPDGRDETLAQMVDAVDAVAAAIEGYRGGKLWKLVVRGDLHAFREAMARAPWVSMRESKEL